MRRVLALTVLLCSCAFAAKRGVILRMAAAPQEQYAEIATRVRNQTDAPITFCLAAGQSSIRRNVVSVTPIPFEVQQNFRRRETDSDQWKALSIGPVRDDTRIATVLDAGKSADFPFAVAKPHLEIRLVLRYCVGAIRDLNCQDPPSGWIEVKSKPAVADYYYILD